MTNSESVKSGAWTAAGAWEGGTLATVAAHEAAVAAGRVVHGLAGGRAGLFRWRADAPTLTPTLRGVVDPSIISVTIAGEPSAPTAWAATETGRLYRLDGFGPDPAVDETWREVTAWAGLGVAMALAASPNFADDRTFFVGTPAGIFRTLNGGEHWESCNFGLIDTEVLCLACAPTYGERELLWAGTAAGGLYRSRNGGRAWRESGMGLPDAPVQALVVSPAFAEDQTIFVGMEEHGVYQSQDGGESWSPFGLSGESVNSLGITPRGRLLAGTFNGLFASPVTAPGWQALADADDLIVLALDAAGAQVAVGTYGGGLALATLALDATGVKAAWQAPTAPLHSPPVVTAATAEDWLALDGDGALAHTADGGASWMLLPEGSGEGVFGVSGGVDVTGSPVYFAATGDGLLRWQPGEAWQAVEAALLDAHQVLAVELAPDFGQSETLLVAGSDGVILLSTDGGARWREVVGLWPGQTLLQAHFAPHPGPVRELLALTTVPTAEGHFALNLWESHDEGINWENLAALTSGVPAALTAWPRDAQERALFLATQHRLLKLYAPAGAGQNGDGTGAQGGDVAVHQYFFDEQTRVTALAASPTYDQDGTLWAATTGGLFESGDRGVTWAQKADLPSVAPIVALLPDAEVVRAVTLGGQVWTMPR